MNYRRMRHPLFAMALTIISTVGGDTCKAQTNIWALEMITHPADPDWATVALDTRSGDTYWTPNGAPGLFFFMNMIFDIGMGPPPIPGTAGTYEFQGGYNPVTTLYYLVRLDTRNGQVWRAEGIPYATHWVAFGHLAPPIDYRANGAYKLKTGISSGGPGDIPNVNIIDTFTGRTYQNFGMFLAPL